MTTTVEPSTISATATPMPLAAPPALLDVLGDPAAVTALAAIAGGARTSRALGAAVGLSQLTLTQALRTLERHGMLTRWVTPTSRSASTTS